MFYLSFKNLNMLNDKTDFLKNFSETLPEIGQWNQESLPSFLFTKKCSKSWLKYKLLKIPSSLSNMKAMKKVVFFFVQKNKSIIYSVNGTFYTPTLQIVNTDPKKRSEMGMTHL